MVKAPTDEQVAILDAADRTDLLKIEAMAGTGKTTTLEMASFRKKGRGLYLAFNRAIAQEAKSRFSNDVECRTFHSLAFGYMAELVAHRLEGKDNGTLTPMRVKSILSLRGLGPLSSIAQAGMVRETFNAFLYSPDPIITKDHVPDHVIAQVLLAYRLTPADRVSLCEALAGDAQRLWDLMWATNSQIPVTHDSYLKAYGLEAPKLPFDYLEIDEAQDMNPMMMTLAEHQDCQLILVGDSMQSIYAYRGAQNALERIRKPDMQTCFLTRSFRFGDDIAARANVILGNLNAAHPIKGMNMDRSRLTGPNASLYRSNLGMFSAVIDHVRSNKGSFAIEGGTKDMVALLNGVEQLMHGKPTAHPDLAGFKTWYQYRQTAEQEGAPEDMQRLVKLVTQYPRKMLMAALRKGDEKGQKGEPVTHVYSTAHKSKGREWPEVTIGPDFPAPSDSPTDPLDRDEARLAYVAVTRAQRRLRGANELVVQYANRLKAIATHAERASTLEMMADEMAELGPAERKKRFNQLPKADQEALLGHLRQRNQEAQTT